MHARYRACTSALLDAAVGSQLHRAALVWRLAPRLRLVLPLPPTLWLLLAALAVTLRLRSADLSRRLSVDAPGWTGLHGWGRVGGRLAAMALPPASKRS